MVAKVNPGKSIRGVLNYNENKVKAGKATCIAAVGFGCEANELSFKEKLNRFTDLTSRNQITQTNAVHISLNFDPSEKFDRDKLCRIAESYLQKIGFGDQPYLVYEHRDANHPHIHIGTVNIKENGDRIGLHNIGKNESEVARKEIEQEFGLIPAESRKQKELFVLKPADLKAAFYGKTETKAAISNVVRCVASNYRFTSLAEYNAVLSQFNVIACRGEPESAMFKKGGLLYRLMDSKGMMVGVPIKASSIYPPDKPPTLKNIEAKYADNKARRKPYGERVSRTIEKILAEGVDKEGFRQQLIKEGIHVVFRENEEGHLYGITFVDNKTHCVFNGSDLGKSYSTNNLRSRFVEAGTAAHQSNRTFVARVLQETDYGAGFMQVLTQWLQNGLIVHATTDEAGMTRFFLGHAQTPMESFIPADKKMTAYLNANALTDKHTRVINDNVMRGGMSGPYFHPSRGTTKVDITDVIVHGLEEMIRGVFEYTYTDYYLPAELLREAKRKKKRRRS